MTSLPNITLIALGSTDVVGMLSALKRSSTHIQFGAIKLVTDKRTSTVPRLDNIEVCEIHPMHSIDEWNKAIVYDLWKYVDTDYCILVHGDGYIINPDLWNDAWLQYDYIGAPWPLPQDDYSYRDENGNIVRVGNSVGLRSRKLLKLPTDLELEWRSYFGNTNEDGFFTCHHRTLFKSRGIKYAPLDVAVRFSKEHEIPENVGLDTFMFHAV
jgi:hypothetical protein